LNRFTCCRLSTIAGRRFTTPQGSEECFEHFLEGFGQPRQELLAELSEGIAACHSQAIPISSCSEEPALLLELPRFIVVYHLQHGSVEVTTILCKRDPARPCRLLHISRFTSV
jgi:hypothetical protein